MTVIGALRRSPAIVSLFGFPIMQTLLFLVVGFGAAAFGNPVKYPNNFSSGHALSSQPVGSPASQPLLPLDSQSRPPAPTEPTDSQILSVRQHFLRLQQRIVTALNSLDSKPFIVDSYRRPPNGTLRGDGRTMILEGGDVWERAGIGFSDVSGDRLPKAATAQRPWLEGWGFRALGVSLVVHPRNPYCPAVHMNVRLFVATPPAKLNNSSLQSNDRADSASTFWFGGGSDLTPNYGFVADAQHFHRRLRDALRPHGAQLYDRFKRQCDEYFRLPHRQNESRGIGGLFFDDFDELGFRGSWDMTRAVGDAFLDAYMPIARRRVGLMFGQRQREWQAVRRSRYAEFNLLDDRGTLFGLQSGGRTDSILLSMPPTATWTYGFPWDSKSVEAAFVRDFLRPRDWISP